VAPDGTVVAIAPPTGEAVVVADIDVARADDKRRPDGTDVYAARRPSLYAPLAEPPRGRVEPAGAERLRVALVQPDADGETAIGEAALLVAGAVAQGAELVVLPELFCFEGATVGVPAAEAAARAEAAVAALAGALAGSGAHAVTSLPLGAAHAAVLVGAGGVVATQGQLHATARHPWATDLADDLAVAVLPWGRLALVVGDDAVYPETFRLAALADADVAAVPFHAQERWELETGLLERAAETRVNLAAASRPTPAGASIAVPLSGEFTLWSPSRTQPFDGVISRPEPVLAEAGDPLTLVDLSPAQAVNRMVSKGTDLVDGRPWSLLDAHLTT
jgi:predicted amidohydrolase